MENLISLRWTNHCIEYETNQDTSMKTLSKKFSHYRYQDFAIILSISHAPRFIILRGASEVVRGHTNLYALKSNMEAKKYLCFLLMNIDEKKTLVSRKLQSATDQKPTGNHFHWFNTWSLNLSITLLWCRRHECVWRWGEYEKLSGDRIVSTE